MTIEPGWPAIAAELVAAQLEIASRTPTPWTLPSGETAIGGCFAGFPRGISGPGSAGDPAWAGVVLLSGDRVIAEAVVSRPAGAPYEAGLMALREGPLLEAAVRALPALPDVLLVNATGLDHPRRCGLALHLGAVLSLPTVGVTHRPLLAKGGWPGEEAGATAPLVLGDSVVGYWLRTRVGTRPLVVHGAWRTTPEVAVEVVRRSLLGHRTPEPIRRARELARMARQGAGRDR